MRDLINSINFEGFDHPEKLTGVGTMDDPFGGMERFASILIIALIRAAKTPIKQAYFAFEGTMFRLTLKSQYLDFLFESAVQRLHEWMGDGKRKLEVFPGGEELYVFSLGRDRIEFTTEPFPQPELEK